MFVWLCVVCVGQLVPVGLQALAGLPRPAYLPSGLLGAFHHPGVVWIPYLEAGFPLRCFQRLSFPNYSFRVDVYESRHFSYWEGKNIFFASIYPKMMFI